MRIPAILAAALLLASGVTVYVLMRPTERGPGYARERVFLGAPEDPPGERETTKQEIERSRAMKSRILCDLRDARVVRLGDAIREERPEGVVSVSTAVCVRVDDPKLLERVRGAKLRFEVSIDGAGGMPSKSSDEIELGDAAAAWRGIHLETLVGQGTSYTLRSEVLVPPDGEPIPPGAVSVCWAKPCVVNAHAPKRHTNVLVISIDTLRADHLGCYGHPRPTSPRIDELAARGVLFERAYSTAPWTLPSYGTLFSGMEVAAHRAGVIPGRENAWGSDEAVAKQVLSEGLRADVRTLAERLSAAHFRTAGFYSNTFLNPNSGLDRGFETYVYYQYNASAGVDLASQWIDAHAQAPWFVFLHLMDPHAPYAPPAPYDEQFAERSVDSLADYPPDTDKLRAAPPPSEMQALLKDLYDGEIAFTDAQIGRFLDHLADLGELDDTLIVIHADHGEEFWEHGGYEHGHDLYDELLRVPLIFVMPRQLAPGVRVTTRVTSADVLPSVLELLGLRLDGELDGKSLVPLLVSGVGSDRDFVAESVRLGPSEQKASFSGALKLIARGTQHDRLFDLANDPGETKNLAAERAGDVQRLRAELLHRYQATQKLPAGVTARVSEAERRRLRNMGYTGDDEDDEPK